MMFDRCTSNETGALTARLPARTDVGALENPGANLAGRQRPHMGSAVTASTLSIARYISR
jgi:hypothetical protein